MKPLHVYPMGQTHRMTSECWCRPYPLIENRKSIWVHRFCDFESGEEPVPWVRNVEFVNTKSEYFH